MYGMGYGGMSQGGMVHGGMGGACCPPPVCYHPPVAPVAAYGGIGHGVGVGVIAVTSISFDSLIFSSLIKCKGILALNLP